MGTISKCIDLGIVLTKWEMEHVASFSFDYQTDTKMMQKMEDQQFSRLIELIHEHDYYWRMSDDQRWWDLGNRQEKEIKELLRNYIWDDVEPLIKEDWRKESVKSLF